ncbi:MAG: DUF2269 family protein [Marmoricola sp.]
MFKILLALHLLTAVFAIGPLVGAATTAARGLRSNDAAATASAARTLTIYSYASILVIIFGFGLLSSKTPYGDHGAPGDFGDLWVWLSLVLWVVALGITLGLVVPALRQATATVGAAGDLRSLSARVGAGGGVVALIFAVIVFLMVYQPGS